MGGTSFRINDPLDSYLDINYSNELIYSSITFYLRCSNFWDHLFYWKSYCYCEHISSSEDEGCLNETYSLSFGGLDHCAQDIFGWDHWGGSSIAIAIWGYDTIPLPHNISPLPHGAPPLPQDTLPKVCIPHLCGAHPYTG